MDSTRQANTLKSLLLIKEQTSINSRKERMYIIVEKLLLKFYFTRRIYIWKITIPFPKEIRWTEASSLTWVRVILYIISSETNYVWCDCTRVANWFINVTNADGGKTIQSTRSYKYTCNTCVHNKSSNRKCDWFRERNSVCFFVKVFLWNSNFEKS